eukprot:7390773-Prymnesium_polylepis.1
MPCRSRVQDELCETHLEKLATVRVRRTHARQLVAHDVCRTGTQTPDIGLNVCESDSRGSSPGSVHELCEVAVQN